MELQGHYDKEVDLLYIWTGQKEAVGATAECSANLAVFVGTEDGHDIVGFEVIGGGGAYLRMEEGYDAEADTLTIGETASSPSLITENGDLVAHWRLDKMEPAGFMEPIGVTVRNAKATLNRVRVL